MQNVSKTVFNIKFTNEGPELSESSGNLEVVFHKKVEKEQILIDTFFDDENKIKMFHFRLIDFLTARIYEIDASEYTQIAKLIITKESAEFEYRTSQGGDLRLKTMNFKDKPITNDDAKNIENREKNETSTNKIIIKKVMKEDNYLKDFPIKFRDFFLKPYSDFFNKGTSITSIFQKEPYRASKTLVNSNLKTEDIYQNLFDYLAGKKTTTGKFLYELARGKYLFNEQGESRIQESREKWKQYESKYGKKIAWILLLGFNGQYLDENSKFSVFETCIDFDSTGTFIGMYSGAKQSLLRNSEEICYFRNRGGKVIIEPTETAFEVYLTFLKSGQHYKLNLKKLRGEAIKLWANHDGNLAYELGEESEADNVILNKEKLSIDNANKALENFNKYFFQFRDYDIAGISFWIQSAREIGEIFNRIENGFFEFIQKNCTVNNSVNINNNNNNAKPTLFNQKSMTAIKSENWSRTIQFLLSFGLLENIDYNHFNNYGMKTAVFLALVKTLTAEKINNFKDVQKKALKNFKDNFIAPLKKALEGQKSSVLFSKTSIWQSIEYPCLNDIIKQFQNMSSNRTQQLLYALGYNVESSAYYSIKINRLCEVLTLLDKEVIFDENMQLLLNEEVAQRVILGFSDEKIKLAIDNFNNNYREPFLEKLKTLNSENKGIFYSVTKFQSDWENGPAKTIADIAIQYIRGGRTQDNLNDLGLKIDRHYRKYYGELVATQLALVDFLLNSKKMNNPVEFDHDLKWAHRIKYEDVASDYPPIMFW